MRFDLWSKTLSAGLLASVAALATEAGHWRKEYFPNSVLTTHKGKRVRFYDDLIKDKVVAISFIFTRCKGPCPAETANLRRVQKLLGERMGREVHFYSITLDPKNDGPRALRNYARRFGAGPGWTFLTGSKSDIDLIRSKLGLYSAADAARSKKEKLEEHSISFVVGNEATGRWIKRSAFDEPVVLAQLLGVSLQSLPVRRAAEKSYSAATEIPRMSAGETLFRNRCATCHGLAGGGPQDLGPDLAGILGVVTGSGSRAGSVSLIA